MLSKKNLMVTMVTGEFLENRIILRKSVATMGVFLIPETYTFVHFLASLLSNDIIRSHIPLGPALLNLWTILNSEENSVAIVLLSPKFKQFPALRTQKPKIRLGRISLGVYAKERFQPMNEQVVWDLHSSDYKKKNIITIGQTVAMIQESLLKVE